MLLFHRPRRVIAAVAATASGLVLVAPSARADHRDREHDGHQGLGVVQVNLVSDLDSVGASLVDPDVVNPWGLALGPTTPLWSANTGTDTSTLYTSDPGSNVATKVPTVRVTFPDTPELPTGQVFNATESFLLSNTTTSSPARFIYSTITGRIAAWSPAVDPLVGNAQIVATVPGAVYTGLALATAKKGPQLYAANFGQGRVDVFDTNFDLQPASHRRFHDRHLPAGYSPFGIATLRGNLFVAYAKVDPATHMNAVGEGLGYVDEFTPKGRLVGRVASQHTLNAPWGLEIAPPSWGRLAGDLLVGNFGDGRISVIEGERHGDGERDGERHGARFDGDFEGLLRNQATGAPLVIPGLWTLLRGTDTTGGTDSIWFSAGIEDEQHGLIGVLRRP